MLQFVVVDLAWEFETLKPVVFVDTADFVQRLEDSSTETKALERQQLLPAAAIVYSTIEKIDSYSIVEYFCQY